MPLNKQKGNMYPWITHTWNPIRGKCPHDCSYCYMKRIPNIGKLRFVEKEMRTNLGEGKIVFVGSSCDMWAEKVPLEWIEKVLNHCKKFPKNTYIFQTKKPLRFYELLFIEEFTFPLNSILGATIETNKHFEYISKAPFTTWRLDSMEKVSMGEYPIFISIEPIMDFWLSSFVSGLKRINPQFISVGADSGNNDLPEPPAWKVKKLIEELEQFTEVKIKDNSERLLNAEV